MAQRFAQFDGIAYRGLNPPDADVQTALFAAGQQ